MKKTKSMLYSPSVESRELLLFAVNNERVRGFQTMKTKFARLARALLLIAAVFRRCLPGSCSRLPVHAAAVFRSMLQPSTR